MIDKELYNIFKSWRRDKAIKEDIKPYIIFSDSTLIEMVNRLPKNREELLNIKGIGEKKLDKYGDEIITLINEYSEKSMS